MKEHTKEYGTLRKAFNQLRKLGYFAKQNHTCCQSCGWAEVPEGKGERAVFYHQQDKMDLNESGLLYLAWSGDGQEIVKVFNDLGFHTDWNGSNNVRIKIKVW